jgi:hypothetical protein
MEFLKVKYLVHFFSSYISIHSPSLYFLQMILVLLFIILIVTASCTMDTGGKAQPGPELTTHPHLVPRLRMGRSDTFSHPKRLHGV